MTRTLKINDIRQGIATEQTIQSMPIIRPFLPEVYAGRRLTKTEAVVEAAAALADQEMEELRQAGYNVAPYNPFRRNQTTPRTVWLNTAIQTAADEERFHDG